MSGGRPGSKCASVELYCIGRVICRMTYGEAFNYAMTGRRTPGKTVDAQTAASGGYTMEKRPEVRQRMSELESAYQRVLGTTMAQIAAALLELAIDKKERPSVRVQALKELSRIMRGEPTLDRNETQRNKGRRQVIERIRDIFPDKDQLMMDIARALIRAERERENATAAPGSKNK